MRTRLAAVLLMALGTSSPARADVIVLANRTARDVTFTAAGTLVQTVAPFDQAVLYTDGSINVSYTSGSERRTYRLEPDSAYFFADLPGGAVAISGIGETGGGGRPGDGKPAGGDGVLLKAPPLETIPVRMFVDEEEPAVQAVWEPRLTRRIAAASAVLERTCRVRIEVAGAGTWVSDNQAPDFPALLTDFEHKLPRRDTRLFIGFTSQRTPEEGGTLHLGGTRLPLHPYVLTREWTPTTEPGRLEVLLHELGHYLGAVHSPETTSVMRPKLGDGRSVSLKFPVGFDPLNTLAMNLVVGEVRARHIRSLAQVSPPNKERLRRIYNEVHTAIPDDPTPGVFIARLGPATPKPDPARPDFVIPNAPRSDPARPGVPNADAAPAAPAESDLDKNARAIIAVIIRAAEKNRNLPDRSTPGTAPPFRRSGDALTEYYVREAAAAARDLPQGEAAPAFLVGLAIALDTADLFRNNPLTGGRWRRIETDEQRQLRLKVLGLPTVYARHDSCQHFVDSAALVALHGPEAADAAGVVKELLDSREGGSGFSFADLASDMSGVAFGREVLAEPGLLSVLTEKFTVSDYAVPPDGLVEGLTSTQFADRYGTVADPRFLREQEMLRKRVRDLPAYRPAPPQKAAPEKTPEEKVPAAEDAGREKIVPEEKVPKEKAPETKVPESKPSQKPAPEPPAAVTPPSSPGEATALKSGPVPAATPKTPPSALALGGLGLTALIGSFYAIWPRRPAPGKRPAVFAPIFSGTVLALTGFALLGAAYARWAAPEAVSEFAASDLDPVWTEAPVDPFKIPTLRAVRLPAFSESRTVLGATGRDGRGHIWFAVSAGDADARSARLMEYGPGTDLTTDRGDVLDNLNRLGLLRPRETQSTIRTRIVQSADGYLYFASTGEAATAGASERPGAAGPHTVSRLWRLRPADGRWEHLLAVPEKLTAAACGGQYVFVLGYPDHVVYQYNCATGQTRSARVGGIEGHFSNAIVADHRGHVYVPRLKQAPAGAVATLVELNHGLEEIAESPLDPAAQSGNDELLGLVAAQPLADHSTACVTDRGFLFRVISGEGERPAEVLALGAFHPRKEAGAVSLFSPDGQRYLMGLARRPGFRDGRYEWLVFDINTRRSVVVHVDPPEENGRPLQDLLLSGCMTRDDQGRFYVAGSCHRTGIDCPVLLQIGLTH